MSKGVLCHSRRLKTKIIVHVCSLIMAFAVCLQNCWILYKTSVKDT